MPQSSLAVGSSDGGKCYPVYSLASFERERLARLERERAEAEAKGDGEGGAEPEADEDEQDNNKT